MRVLVLLALIAIAVATNPANHGQTIMAPGSSHGGATTMHPSGQVQVKEAHGPMQSVKVEGEKPAPACGCCGQAVCGCCAAAKPKSIAPEIKEQPKPVCGCAPKCFPSSCQCPNTCGCCTPTHITPEIKTKTNACNCCHLDKCGCCVKETISPEEKVGHIAPELKEKPKCPCLGTPKCGCA